MSRFFVIILFLLTIGSAVGVIYNKHQNRKLFAQLQSLEQTRDQLVIEYSQLQLEESTWATHGRIEELASTQLDMYVPVYESIKFIDFTAVGGSHD